MGQLVAGPVNRAATSQTGSRAVDASADARCVSQLAEHYPIELGKQSHLAPEPGPFRRLGRVAQRVGQWFARKGKELHAGARGRNAEGARP